MKGIACLVAAGAALLLPTCASALLPWQSVRVTPHGPVPRVVYAKAGLTPVAWYNDGAHARRVRFADGSCRVRVTSSSKELRGCRWDRPGRHAYTIEGLPAAVAHGVVVVRP